MGETIGVVASELAGRPAGGDLACAAAARRRPAAWLSVLDGHSAFPIVVR